MAKGQSPFGRAKTAARDFARDWVRGQAGNTGAVLFDAVVDGLSEQAAAALRGFTCTNCKIPTSRIKTNLYLCGQCHQYFRTGPAMDAPAGHGTPQRQHENDAPTNGMPFAQDFSSRGRAREPEPEPWWPPPPESSDGDDALDILGLTRGTTTDDVKQRRRELALRFHSDREGGSDDSMKEVNAAADYLLAHPEELR